MHYFNDYGWFTASPIPGRATDTAPPLTSETEVPGENRANWTGHRWLVVPYVAPPPPPPPALEPVPQSVTMRQARLALLKSGKLANVDAVLAAIPDAAARTEAQITWEYSTAVERTHPLIGALGAGLGMNDGAIDDLFRLADTL